MIFEVCAIISVIIFAILAFFAIRTLYALEKSLMGVNHIAQDLSHKMNLMESTFKSISTIGDIGEIKLNEFRDYQLHVKEFGHAKEFTHEKPFIDKYDYTEDLADIVLASLKLGTKLFRR